MSGISKMLLIVFVLFILQALGGWYQIQNYRKAMRRVHQYGNVGFGQRKGRLTAGYIIMIACDHDGIITRCEIMQGLSFLAKFKPLNEFLGKDMKGRSIYEFLDDMKDFDKKTKKRNIKVISMHLKHLTRDFRTQSLKQIRNKQIRKKQSVRKHRMH